MRAEVKLSAVLSALSYALDLTEGHPRGHAARSALIGMRLARILGLADEERSDLFYALLLKDIGCSSNSARVYQLFGGDDQTAKRAVWEHDWRTWRSRIRYAVRYAEPGGSIAARLTKFLTLAMSPNARREIFQIRCERGAEIARAIGMSDRTAEAVRSMDEHWDGGGHPDGLRRLEIPQLAASSGCRKWRRSSGALAAARRPAKPCTSVAPDGSTRPSSMRSSP